MRAFRGRVVRRLRGTLRTTLRTTLRRRLRARERGAAALVVALVVSAVVVPLSGLVLDIGLQRVARRDAQAVADTVAMDLARSLAVDPASVTDAAAHLRAQKTGGAIGTDTAVHAVAGYVAPGAAFVSDQSLGCAGSPYNSYFGAVPAGGRPNAVLVTVRRTVDFAFMGGSGGVCRSAIGTSASSACFRLGSFAAALDLGDSALDGVFEALVGDSLGVNLKALSYDGLATSQIDLGALAAELGVGSATELADLSNVSVKDLLSAGGRVLNQEGQTAAATQLMAIAAKVTADPRLTMGDLLSVGDGAVVGASINSLDLLGASALANASVIDGNNFLDTGVAWSDPWLSSGSVLLKVLEAPRQACGPADGSTKAETAQVALDADLDLTLNSGATIAGLVLSTGNGTSKTAIHVAAQLAGATGTLDGLDCGAATAADPESVRVRVDSRLTNVSVSVPFHLHGEVSTDGLLRAGVLSALPLDLSQVASTSVVLDLGLTAGASLGTAPHVGAGDTVYSVPPHTYAEPEPSLGSGEPLSIPTIDDVDVAATSTVTLKVKMLFGLATVSIPLQLADVDLGPILNSVMTGDNRIGASIDNVADNLNAALRPVSTMLGLRVDGADVYGVPHPTCGQPSLIG